MLNGSAGRGYGYDQLDVLRRLSPGTPVRVWFDSSGFNPTFFQFNGRGDSAFSGGSFDGGLTYINPSQIRAIRIGG